MAPTFVVVPQWQGSISPRAMRLVDGAAAIQGDLPFSATRLVDVPVEAGDALDTGVHRFSAIQHVRERHTAVLKDTADWALSIGGDCGIALTAVEHAARTHPGDLAVVWFDAHPDLHTPETSPSGGFCGMVLRAISGEGPAELELAATSSVSLDRVVLAGIRDVDDAEDVLLQERGLVSVSCSELTDPAALVGAVAAIGAKHVFVHIDLDVLDPSALGGLNDLIPFGLSVAELGGAITALRAEFTLAGATITGFAPASPEAATDDLPSILRIIGALTR
ncbi:arginase family protein [Cryobacterium levicorallinum]|uniref:Arginase family protein n=2 Tax=Cryobacterium levicorallinum TaxID=995038 RepID=A0A4R8VTU1_9MICO|nr:MULTISPECIES: arginase family protein [Cryobacterium]TFB88811.1 arginase family protein [Cryobacterium levicorallinum]GEP27719.1 arginase [Cryobacterium levicorallinum]